MIDDIKLLGRGGNIQGYVEELDMEQLSNPETVHLTHAVEVILTIHFNRMESDQPFDIFILM